MSDNPQVDSDQAPAGNALQPVSRQLEINFDAALAAEVISAYATNLVVQRTEYEYILSFFEVTPPILIGPAEKVQKKLTELESAPTRCVARIIVAASRMPDFVSTLQNSLQKDPVAASE